MKILLSAILALFLSGCASAVMRSGCGHITGAHVTIPYVGGDANGNAYGCSMGCLGMNCKAPDYTALATITTEYIKDASKDNSITTTGASLITVTPVSK
jgi:hypothetical protein